jgi:O-antigen ligase
MISTRYNINLIFYLFAAAVISFAFSLFFIQLFTGLLSIFWLFEKNQNKKTAIDIIAISVLSFGIVRMISIFFSEHFALSSESFYKEGLFYFGFFSFSYYLRVFDEKKKVYLVNFLIVSSVITALIGITKFNLNLVERAESFTSGYTTFSTFLLINLGLILCMYDEKIKNFSLYKIVSAAILICGLITSLGRTNIAIAFLFLLIGLLFKKIKILHGFLILIFTAIICTISFYNNSIQAAQRIENPTQYSDRDIIYNGADKLKFEHPFLGFGPRTFREIFPFTEQFADRGVGGWHNDYLQIYFESGLLGLFTFLFLIAVVLITAIKIIRIKNYKNLFNDLTMGILFSFSGLLISALTAGFITSAVISIVVAFLIAFLSAVKFNINSQKN